MLAAVQGAFVHDSLVIQEPPRGGSIMGRHYIHRDRVACKEKLLNDYFGDYPKYPPSKFRCRYRMSRELFQYIHASVVENNIYFVDKKDAAKKDGVSSYQKVLSSIRLLGTGGTFDDTDKYLQLGQSTASECVEIFCDIVINVFEEEYLRIPTAADTTRILAQNTARGFPGMMGSIDCMHWVWKNCPTAWKGTHTGHKKKPTIVLEAVVDQDLLFWYAFFGTSGSHNDLNVLQRSDVFQPIQQDYIPTCNYEVNGNQYNLGYYLADRIYPKYATFVKTIPDPRGEKQKYYAMCQEAARKDVERAFGVLQARFHIIKRSARSHSEFIMAKIMRCCVILHNMIVENEREGVENWRPPRGEDIPPLVQRAGMDYAINAAVQRHGYRNPERHK